MILSFFRRFLIFGQRAVYAGQSYDNQNHKDDLDEVQWLRAADSARDFHSRYLSSFEGATCAVDRTAGSFSSDGSDFVRAGRGAAGSQQLHRKE
jgi:hypothetical protein